jgi:hypothetical protein
VNRLLVVDWTGAAVWFGLYWLRLKGKTAPVTRARWSVELGKQEAKLTDYTGIDLSPPARFAIMICCAAVAYTCVHGRRDRDSGCERGPPPDRVFVTVARSSRGSNTLLQTRFILDTNPFRWMGGRLGVELPRRRADAKCAW